MEDVQIIELFRERNERAIQEVSEKYGAYCRKIAERVLHSEEDAKECVNDAWLKVWESIPPQRPRRLRAYLAKIVRNLAFHRYEERNAKKRGGGEISLVLEELEECVASGAGVEDAFSVKELEASIQRFVDGLPQREAKLFVRRYFFTEPVKLIAQRSGLTENHVMVILSRVRGKLKHYLEQEGYVV